MTMTSRERDKIRTELHLLNPRPFSFLKDDFSNLDDIIAEYDYLYKIGRELVVIEDRVLVECLASQATERQFFGLCATLLRRYVKVFEVRLAASRGKAYRELLSKEPRDLSDRALNQLIDGNDAVYEMHMDVIMIREYYERFSDLVEAYNQRGFALNNVTKAMDAAISELVINEH